MLCIRKFFLNSTDKEDESISNENEPDAMNFLFDGSNFRGYGSENELIAKAYANDWGGTDPDGNLLPSGTYYFFVVCQGSLRYSGPVTLVY